MTNKHGGARIPGKGRKLGPPKKPADELYKSVPLKLPPDVIKWLAENVDNRNGFIVEAIREKIERESKELNQ